MISPRGKPRRRERAKGTRNHGRTRTERGVKASLFVARHDNSENSFRDSPRKIANPTTAVARPLRFSRSAAGYTEGPMFFGTSARRTTSVVEERCHRGGSGPDCDGRRPPFGTGKDAERTWFGRG